MTQCRSILQKVVCHIAFGIFNYFNTTVNSDSATPKIPQLASLKMNLAFFKNFCWISHLEYFKSDIKFEVGDPKNLHVPSFRRLWTCFKVFEQNIFRLSILWLIKEVPNMEPKLMEWIEICTLIQKGDF